MKQSLSFLKQVFKQFSEDKVGQMSAAFAYVAVFSLGPLLLVVLSVVGYLFGEKAASGALFSQLAGSVGSGTAHTLQHLVANTHKSSHNQLALVFGVVGLVLGASGLTSQLQNSFDTIFNIVPDPASGIKRTLYVKLKNSFLIVVGGAAAMASLIISALIVGLAKKVSHSLGMPPLTLEVLNNLASLAVFTIILYGIYKVLPSVNFPRKVVLLAASAVSILFLIGKVILGVIIGRNGAASAYGAAASLVTLLLWIYYSGQILFLGAEGIKVYGINNSITYGPKKFNLKRQTVVLDAKGRKSKFIEAFARGARKRLDR